jgi:hypothetical protein
MKALHASVEAIITSAALNCSPSRNGRPASAALSTPATAANSVLAASTAAAERSASGSWIVFMKTLSTGGSSVAMEYTIHW